MREKYIYDGGGREGTRGIARFDRNQHRRWWAAGAQPWERPSPSPTWPQPPTSPLTHTNVPGILAHHTQKDGHGRFSNKDSKVELLVLTTPAVCPLLLVIPFQKKAIGVNTFREEGRHLLLCFNQLTAFLWLARSTEIILFYSWHLAKPRDCEWGRSRREGTTQAAASGLHPKSWGLGQLHRILLSWKF